MLFTNMYIYNIIYNNIMYYHIYIYIHTIYIYLHIPLAGHSVLTGQVYLAQPPQPPQPAQPAQPPQPPQHGGVAIAAFFSTV